MIAYVARRLVALLGLLLILSLVIFALLYLAPGDAIHALLGIHKASPELIESLKEKWHLNESFLGQYWHWLKGVLHFDFGESLRSGQPVAETVKSRTGVTAFLVVYSFLLALGLGVPLGILAALKHRGIADRGVVSASVVGVSAPAFVTGVVLIFALGVELGWFPVYGPGTGGVNRLWHMTLPAIALAFSAMALVVKITRSAMIDVLNEDYIAFARARGITSRRVMARYALRNALVPILTAAGTLFVTVLTGAVIVEATFQLPGLGTLLLEAVQTKDLPVLQGVILLFAAVIILVNLIIDIAYAAVDPRIRLAGAPR